MANSLFGKFSIWQIFYLASFLFGKYTISQLNISQILCLASFIFRKFSISQFKISQILYLASFVLKKNLSISQFSISQKLEFKLIRHSIWQVFSISQIFYFGKSRFGKFYGKDKKSLRNVQNLPYRQFAI